MLRVNCLTSSKKWIQVRKFEKYIHLICPKFITLRLFGSGIFNTNQQDAQEALSAILDGVHSELERTLGGAGRVSDENSEHLVASEGSVVRDCFLIFFDSFIWCTRGC
jgi:ubiquitin C-terminal hydrolase